MGIIDTIKSKLDDLAAQGEETVLYEKECADCGHTFMGEAKPDETTCEECGSEDLSERSRMVAGDVAGGGGAG